HGTHLSPYDRVSSTRLSVRPYQWTGRWDIDRDKSRVASLEPEMLDQPSKDGRSNGHGSGGLVVEDLQNLTFQVHRKVFVSPEILEDENRAIFDKCWVYVGHASEVKNPGDFRTRSVAGRPIIFCRDRKGEVRALFNVCRHRG